MEGFLVKNQNKKEKSHKTLQQYLPLKDERGKGWFQQVPVNQPGK